MGQNPAPAIHNGEISSSISSNKTLSVEKMQHASGKKKKERCRRRWKAFCCNDPDDERNQEQRLKDGSEPDEVLVPGKAFCQEVPDCVGGSCKKNVEKRA
jgi:hypothetical protein